MQRQSMSGIVAEAKKRRAKYLAEFEKKATWSIADYARFKNVDPTRMGQLLKKAKEDIAK